MKAWELFLYFKVLLAMLLILYQVVSRVAVFWVSTPLTDLDKNICLPEEYEPFNADKARTAGVDIHKFD